MRLALKKRLKDAIAELKEDDRIISIQWETLKKMNDELYTIGRKHETQLRRAIDLAIESTQDAAYAANYHGDELIEVIFNKIDRDAIVQKVLDGTNE